MKIRLLNFDTDSNTISKIWEEGYKDEFSLPDLTNAVTFAVVEDDDGIVIAFGIVKVFAEAIMILDQDESDRIKSDAMKLLLSKAENDCKSNGIKQLHTFCKDESFADLLIKHFDFKKIKTVGLSKEL